MIPIIAIRPQPGCDATVDAARVLGLDAHGFPLFRIEPVAWQPPAPKDIDAVLIGSANALRHGGPAIARYAGKPAYAVGQTTAEVARRAGLEVVTVGTGGLQAVLDTIRPSHGRLLRLAGQERIVLKPPSGVTLIERVVYASRPEPMPDALADLLAQPAIVLLHSAEAARRFAAECDRRAIDRSRISLAVIGPRVSGAAGAGWRIVATAAATDDAAMLALAGLMCQEADGAR